MFGLDPGGQGRLFYLLALGMALLVMAFARYRGRLGQGLQHAAIWALIFAGVVIAYGFSDTLRGELVPASAQRLGDSAVALRRFADGHFRAELEVNGRSVPFLIDTGATAMVLSRRDAERVGLDLDRLSFTSPAMTANGAIYSARVTLDRVELGPFVDEDVPAMVNGGELDLSLLGMRYLDRFARVSIEGDRLILER
jgi:aspartyl protease family protein